MPTQRTKEIVIDYVAHTLIKLAARGMYEANRDEDFASQCGPYGGFYTALQLIMGILCYHDPDFMELWNSNRVQGSLDISSWKDYPEQIKNVLASEGINVTIYI